MSRYSGYCSGSVIRCHFPNDSNRAEGNLSESPFAALLWPTAFQDKFREFEIKSWNADHCAGLSTSPFVSF